MPHAAILVASGMLFQFQTASAELVMRTGFESSQFNLGNLDGQSGWSVSPKFAIGTIQTAFVYDGRQALELIDGDSVGIAQTALNADISNPLILAEYAMMVPAAWVEGAEEFDNRFEAQMRLEVVDTDGEIWGLEFGLLRTPPVSEYNGLPPNTTVYYVELTLGETIFASAYSDPVDFLGVSDKWHMYRLEFGCECDRITLFVDGIVQAQTFGDADYETLNYLQLQNQRWGSTPDNSRAIYYDALKIKDSVSTGETADLTEFAVAFGTLVSGGLADLEQSDNLYVRTRTAPNFSAFEPNLTELMVIAVTNVSNPQVLDITIESRTSQAATAKFLLRNFTTGERDVIATFATSVFDDEQFFSNLPAADYVRSDGMIRARIRHSVFAVFAAGGMDSYFDHLHFQVQ
jgi:hypothetical protein